MGSQERRMPQDEEHPERDRAGRGDMDEETDAVRGREDDGRDVEPQPMPAAERARKPAKRKK